MAEPTLDDLRAVLRAHAADVLVPEPPLDAVRAGVRSGRRRTAVRAVAVAAALAAAVAGVVALGTGRGDQHPEPAPRPTGTPTTLDTLPRGAPPRIAYAVGKDVSVAGRMVEMDKSINSVEQVGEAVVIGLDQGPAMVYTPTFAGFSLLAEHPVGAVVLGSDGAFAAWQTGARGRAVVRVYPMLARDPVREQAFPATPHCCDDPFTVDGLTTDGRVMASRPATSEHWVWDFRAGAAGIRRISGFPRGGQVTQVVGNLVVVRLDAGGFSAGTVDRDGAYRETARVTGTYAADFADPDEGRVAYLSEGQLHVRRRGDTGPGAVVRLPAGADDQEVRWEDAGHVLVRLAFFPISAPFSEDAPAPRTVVLRCGIEAGTCERAVDVVGNVTLG